MTLESGAFGSPKLYFDPGNEASLITAMDRRPNCCAPELHLSIRG